MWNPFKKKEETSRLDPKLYPKVTLRDVIGKPVYIGVDGYTIGHPKLTKTELICLNSCIDFALKGCKIIRIEPNLRKAVHMKALTDKGYLVRVKKGHYSLSFYR